MPAQAKAPLDREQARQLALDFTAVAAQRVHDLHVRLGDVIESVKPRHRDLWSAVTRLAEAERRAAVCLSRFAVGRCGWQTVETALQLAGICRDELRRRNGSGLRALGLGVRQDAGKVRWLLG